MGYRNYFYLIEVKDYNLVKNMTVPELKEFFKVRNPEKYENYEEEGEVYLSIIELLPMENIFEFGKYYENKDYIIDLGTPMFLKKETQEYFYEYKPFIVGKDAIKCAIDFYRKEVTNYYKELIPALENYENEENISKLISSISTKINEWTAIEKMIKIGMDKDKAESLFLPYNLELNEERIVNSYLFEYMIFELVRLYKTIDLKNNILMFCGY